MYSVVLMMALTTGGNTADLGRHHGGGCGETARCGGRHHRGGGCGESAGCGTCGAPAGCATCGAAAAPGGCAVLRQRRLFRGVG